MASKFQSKFQMKGEDKTKPAFQSVHTSMSKLEKKITGFNAAASVALGNLASQGIGKIVAGFKQAIAETIQLTDRIGKLSATTALSTKTLSSLHVASNLAGTSLEAMQKGFQQVIKNAGEANKGLKTYQRLFEQLGIDSERFVRMGAEQQLRVFVDALAKMPSHSEKVNVAMMLAGRAGQDFIKTFKNGAGDLDRFRQKADALGITIGDTATAKVEAFNDSWFELKTTMQGFALTVADKVLPVMTKLMDLVTGVDDVKLAAEAVATAKEELEATVTGGGLAGQSEGCATEGGGSATGGSAIARGRGAWTLAGGEQG